MHGNERETSYHSRHEPEHVVDRAEFRCAVCARPWPCAPAKVQLGEQYARDRTGLAVLMTGYLFDAVHVIDAGPAALHERFIAWTRYPAMSHA